VQKADEPILTIYTIFCARSCLLAVAMIPALNIFCDDCSIKICSGVIFLIVIDSVIR